MSTESALPSITPKEHHNYIAYFLTLSCNLACPYCINLHNGVTRKSQARRHQMEPDEWIKAANRLVLRSDLPLTLQGGEPTIYKGFYRMVNEVREDIQMDLMTNLMFDVDYFIAHVPVWRFNREAPYAPIRVSYHIGQNKIEDLKRKARKLLDAGYKVGLYSVFHPDAEIQEHISKVREECLQEGLDFRTKEFLGEYNGQMYGTFKYEGCVEGSELKRCECRTSEIIVDPQGNVYRCHSDLYEGREPVAHILDEDFNEETIEKFRVCDYYGKCNPCDVKVKTNRFQIFGHTSVEIINVREPEEEEEKGEIKAHAAR